MNATVIQQFLSLILTFLAQVGVKSSSMVGMILSDLIAIVPIVIEEAPKEIAAVKSIIALLKSTGAATADQMAALDALDKQADGGFDDAVAAYLKNHPTPAPGAAS